MARTWRLLWASIPLLLSACGMTSSTTKHGAETVGREYRVGVVRGEINGGLPFTTVNYVKLAEERGKLKVCAAYTNETSPLFASDAQIAILYQDVRSYLQIGEGGDALRIATDFFNPFPYSRFRTQTPSQVSADSACVLTKKDWSEPLASAPLMMRLSRTQYTLYSGRKVLLQTPLLIHQTPNQ